MSTGHLAGALDGRDLSDVVLVRMSGLTGVQVDPGEGVARVNGGTVWQQVVEAAAPHGWAAMHGSSPDVAAAGYLLGGGLSWYARAHGLACAGLRGCEIVTADARVRRVDDASDPELMWALRGGGGNFGVVTELEIDLLPYADAVAGMWVWDQRRAADIVPAWLEWAADVGDQVTTSLRLSNLPPLPDIPAPLRGRRLVVVDGVALTGDAIAETALAPLRALRPELDTWARVPTSGLTRLHMDPEGPTPAVAGDLLLASAPADLVDTLLGVAGPDRGTPLLVAELRQLGGALRRPPARPSALARFDAEFAFFCAAVAPTRELAENGRRAIGELTRALEPWAATRRYLNFTETQISAEAGFAADDWARLRQARRTIDPEGLFVAAHEIV